MDLLSTSEYGAQHRIFRAKTDSLPSKCTKTCATFSLPSVGEETDYNNGSSLSEEVSTDDEKSPDVSHVDCEDNSIKVGDRKWKLDSSVDCRSKKHRGYCDC